MAGVVSVVAGLFNRDLRANARSFQLRYRSKTLRAFFTSPGLVV